MSYDWGPHFIVPTKVLKVYSEQVLLREDYDEELLHKELEELRLVGNIIKVTNPWYFRKKGTPTWIKVGESSNSAENFPVRWNTINLPDGKYEIMGLMHVLVTRGQTEYTIARQNVVEVTVKNSPKKILQWQQYPGQNN